MSQKRFFSMLAALMVGVVLSFAGVTDRASAQQNVNCCTYTFDVNVPPACLPINVWSLWDCGIFGPQPIVANGVQTFPLPTPGCPPACIFFGVSLTGFAPWASFNNPKVYNVNGCCLVARVSFTATGCVHVTIRQTAGPC